MYFSALVLPLLLIGAVAVDEVAEDTLVLVHAVVRHGQRSPDPITTFPTDMYKHFNYYPYGEGELNKEGIQRSFEVGKQLRKRYDKFLGPIYYPDSVEAISSGFTRCRMTMQLLLAGMFPPHSSQIFQEGLPWQPIAYQYIDKKIDPMISFHRCLKYLFVLEFNEAFNECKDRNFINKYLTEKTGMKVESLLSVFFVKDTLKSEVENGLSLPDWVKPIWPEPLMTCAQDYWRHFICNKTVLAATGGTFIKKILDDTKEQIKFNSTIPQRKLFLYTGHDYNIVIFLGMMERFNDIDTNYLSNILFEVHKISGVYGFKVYWDNRDETGLRQLAIPECGMFCPFNEFYDLMKIYLPSSPNKDSCKV